MKEPLLLILLFLAIVACSALSASRHNSCDCAGFGGTCDCKPGNCPAKHCTHGSGCACSSMSKCKGVSR